MQIRNVQNITPQLNDKSIKIYYEHTFLTPVNINENVLTYEYPKHWVDYASGEKAIEIRQIRTIPAGRLIQLVNFSVVREEKKYPLQIYLDLSPQEDMTVFNAKLKEMLQTQLNMALYPNAEEIEISYQSDSNILQFKINSNLKDKVGFYFNDAETHSNRNFQAITCLKDDSLFQNLSKFSAEKININQLEDLLPDNVSVSGSGHL